MITANELRIGNIVDIFEPMKYGGKALVRRGYALTSGHDIDLYSKLADPIPLTEDILLKCGAKLEGSEWQIEYADTAFIFEGSLGRGFYYTGGEGCKLSVLFYNLHELQNIFFALTGEELNIEL